MNPSTTFAPGRPQLRRISCIGFDWRAEVSLRETLALLGARTIDRWQYTDDALADVLVYDSGNALAQAVVRRKRADNAACVCFPSGGQDGDELTLRYPFGASRLIRCLDHASQSLAGRTGAATAAAESLSQRLDNLLATPDVEAIAIRVGLRQGLLHPASGRVAWPVALELDEIARLLGGDVELTALGRHERDVHDAIAAQAGVERAAEALLWAIGITRSGGQALRRINARQAYRLRRWPDFGVIGRRSADLRCTSLLMQRALTPDELARMAALPPAVVTPFLNAAALSGLLLADTAARKPGDNAADGASRFGGVLQRIRTAFALHDVA